MANTTNVNIASLGWVQPLQRNNHFLLDSNAVKDDYSAILTYAETKSTAAVGEIIYARLDDAVANKKAGLYVIKSYGEGAEIERVGSGETGSSAITATSYSDLTSACDGTHAGTVVIITSAISNGEVGENEKTYIPGLYIVGPGTTIDSLKSLSVSSSDGSSVADQVNAIEIRVGSLETVVGSGNTGLVGRVSALEAAGSGDANVIEAIKVNGSVVNPVNKTVELTIPSVPVYSLVKKTDSGDYAAVYRLTKDGTEIGDAINIPKDLVVSSGSIETKTEAGDWGAAGTYIVLVLNDASSTKLYIPASGLVEYITGGDTSEISLTVDSTTHVATASLIDGAIAEAKLDSSLRAKINGKVDSVIETSGSRALIFNEADGGGAKFEHSDGTISFIGVNNGGANGIAGQIYAVDKTNAAIGTKINIEKDKITYIKNKATSERTADDEIATKGDISTAIASIEVQIDDSTIKKDTNNKLYVSTANLSIGGTSLGVVKNGGNIEIQNDGTMMMIWSE